MRTWRGASCETRFVDAVRLRGQMMQGWEGRLVSSQPYFWWGELGAEFSILHGSGKTVINIRLSVIELVAGFLHTVLNKSLLLWNRKPKDQHFSEQPSHQLSLCMPGVYSNHNYGITSALNETWDDNINHWSRCPLHRFSCLQFTVSWCGTVPYLDRQTVLEVNRRLSLCFCLLGKYSH